MLRKFNRYDSKEKQIAFIDKHYTDQQLDEWLEALKAPEIGYDDEMETIGYEEYADEHYTPSSTARDYSPSNPWNAPGMCIHDFI